MTPYSEALCRFREVYANIPRNRVGLIDVGVIISGDKRTKSHGLKVVLGTTIIHRTNHGTSGVFIVFIGEIPVLLIGIIIPEAARYRGFGLKNVWFIYRAVLARIPVRQWY